jgi:valyl-tRNA synthetase
VVDPLSVMDKYGTDAFRFTLAALAAQGRDIRLAEERIEGYRNFANKIWNAARLVLTNLDGYDPALARRGTPSVADRWIKSRLTEAIAAVRKAIDTYRFNDAASAVYQFLWHEYCDWYLEIAKRSLYQPESPEAKAVTQRTLVETLETTLRLLHPFMPFISEELWQRLPHKGESSDRSIMIAPFPKATRKGRDAEAERLMAPVLDFVSAIRTVRSESRISPAVELAVTVKPAGREVTAALESSLAVIGSLARAAIAVSREGARPEGSAVATTPSGDVFVRLDGVVDFEAERQRLRKEIERARKEIAFLEGKLGRPEFVERAPAEVVERERERLVEQRQTEQKLSTSLAALG